MKRLPSMSERDSMHEDLARDHEVKTSSDRSFGLVFTAVFAAIGMWPLVDGGAARWWAIGVAAAVATVAILRPAALAPFNRLWTRLGLLLHRIVNPLIMGLLFFFVVTPTGLLLRLFGKDLLRLRRDAAAASYWIERDPPGPAPDTMKNQF